MNPARVGWLAILGAALAFAVPAVAQANEVTNWNGIATSTLVQFPGPGGGAPPALTVNLAMTQGAVYDAVNAIQRRHRPIVLHKKFHSWASLDAAVATAAYGVLSSLIQDPRAGIAEPLKTNLSQTLTTARNSSLAAIPDGAAKTEGIEAGAAAAEAMLARRANDGRPCASGATISPSRIIVPRPRTAAAMSGYAAVTSRSLRLRMRTSSPRT